MLALRGDGSQMRSYVWLMDAVAAYASALADPPLGRTRTLNVASPDQISVRRVAELVAEEMGVDMPVVAGPGGRASDEAVTGGDPQKLLSLGWRPVAADSETAVRLGVRRLLAVSRDPASKDDAR